MAGMRNIRLVLESLKDLDQNAADKLYVDMTLAGFIPKHKVDDKIMFIFPDGRMLGAKRSGTIETARDVYHVEMYKSLRNTKYYEQLLQTKLIHPIANDVLAKYFNMVIVIPMDEAGYIFIPQGVDVTDSQKKKIGELEKFGYQHIKDYREVQGK